MIDLELRGGVWHRRPTRAELVAGRALDNDAWESEFKRWSRRAVGLTALKVALGLAALAFAIFTGGSLFEHAQLGDIAACVLLLKVGPGEPPAT